ncbi:MAG: hypothetical protein AAB575_06090 [Patescibacteria group bacterium]
MKYGIKIFADTDLDRLDTKINHWLSTKETTQITNVTQSESHEVSSGRSHVTISISYYESMA